MHKRIWFRRWENIDKNGNKHSKRRHILDVLVRILSNKSYMHGSDSHAHETRRDDMCFCITTMTVGPQPAKFSHTAVCIDQQRRADERFASLSFLFLFLSSRFILFFVNSQYLSTVRRSDSRNSEWVLICRKVSSYFGRKMTCCHFSLTYFLFSERVQNDSRRFESNEVSTSRQT